MGISDESLEVRALRRYLIDAGVPHRVTSTINGGHVRGSYHYRLGTDGGGLAVDFAGPSPSRNSPVLRAIYDAFAEEFDQLAELLGPGDFGHADHVHVAVKRGTFLVYPKEPEWPTLPAPLLSTWYPRPPERATGYSA